MRTNLSKVLLAVAFGLFLAFIFSCSSDDGDEGSGGGSSGGGTGTIVVKNSSGTAVSTIRITKDSKQVGSRTANLSNGSKATFTNIPTGRINVRVDTGSGTSFDSRNKSVDLKSGKTITLTRTARSLD